MSSDDDPQTAPAMTAFAYRGMLAIDAEKFSTNADVHLPDFAVEIEDLLAEAMNLAKLAEIWKSREFPSHTGDGYVFGFDPGFLPQVVDSAIPQLQAILHRRQRSAHRNSPTIRLRASLHVGPVPISGDIRRDGIGTARVDVHRLLDCEQVRRALSLADKSTTFVVAIISQRVYEDTIASERCGINPAEVILVKATVDAKDFAMPAYIYTPRPSGELLNKHAFTKENLFLEPEEHKSTNEPQTIQPGIKNDGQVIASVAGDAVFNAKSNK